MSFSKDFIWGSAAASYQIEGAWNEGGKGLSVWDLFCEKEGNVYRGHDGKIACDHYHRFKDDVQIMKELGIKSYRFSFSWPRVLPQGTGRVATAGIDFYSALVDELLEAGITPFPTLFHWDYPYELFCKGGWLNNDSSDWFSEYTALLVDKFSDRIEHWFTLNEPQVFVTLGHINATHAPGLELRKREVLRVIHNVLLSHGKAAKTIRQNSKRDTKIGMVPVCRIIVPADDSEHNIGLARKEMFTCGDLDFPGWSNTWWLDPVFFGKYPEDGLERAGDLMPQIGPDDMEIISTPLDYCATNHYHCVKVRRDQHGNKEYLKPQIGEPLTAISWPVYPQGMYWAAKFLYERYKKPIIIAENGMSNRDWVHGDGKVHDPQRIDYVRQFLKEYRRAADDGVDLAGYFYWSIMDNFEWAEGYKERFGLVHVDYQTQKRTVKDSGLWYRDVIAQNGENL